MRFFQNDPTSYFKASYKICKVAFSIEGRSENDFTLDRCMHEGMYIGDVKWQDLLKFLHEFKTVGVR